MNELEPPRIVGNDINAYCPVCDGRSNFVRTSGAFSPGKSIFLNRHYRRAAAGRFTFVLLSCVTCHIGAYAVFFDNEIIQQSELIDFFPKTSRHLSLPEATPKDIEAEFRSAENCASIQEHRPAAAMLRSTIEKVLKKHGYNQKDLYKKLDKLAADRIITLPLAKQNQEIVRILGNDVLHGDWREISSEEYASAYKYTHRLIDAFYDDHQSVLEELKAIGNIIEAEEKKEESISDEEQV